MSASAENRIVRLAAASNPQEAAQWRQALEAEGIRCRVVGEMLGENLQRHGGVQALVPARVDNGHAAASELVLEAELAQPKPRCPK